MTESKDTLCRLCLKNITEKDFKIIDSVTRDILDVLLLKLTFRNESQEVICNSCVRTLKTALEFKSICLNTDNMIIPYVDGEKMLQVDLNEIYIKENGIRPVTGVSYCGNICRLCMQPVKDEVRRINEEELEAIQKFAPEMNIMIIKDPVVCPPCFDSLCTHNNFLKDCLEVDQRIAYISDSTAKNSKTYVSLSEVIKTEDLESEDLEMNKTEMAIKTECVDIKTEEDEGRTQSKRNIRHHVKQHRDPSRMQMYKCDTCDYQSKKKYNFGNHQLTHKDPSEVQMYKCKDCDYESKFRYTVKHHELKHRDRSQVLLYKCNACDFESRYKKSLISHQLTHQDPTEGQMYRCNDCEYKTRYKNTLAIHVLRHKDLSQVQMYKCNYCDYRGKHKNYLKSHVRIHGKPLKA